MIFDKVKEQIKAKYITNSDLSDLLPSERDLAQEFSVSRPTVRKALSSLEQEGYITKNEGRGYLVNHTTEKYVDHELDSFIGFFQDAIQQGKKISSKIIQQTIIPASKEISTYLEIKPGDLILVLERIRYIDDKPTCIAKSCIPLSILPDIVNYDFAKESLFSVLEDKGIILAFARRSIEVTPPSELDNLYLELKTHEPVFVFTSIGFTKERKPFEYETSKYPAYKTKFESTVSK
ncbi:GntR family transcriptional regulator [Enterococcus asini]|uniref:GntR family transcriptional regulator n=1 Tax=Enterococcus TaxID=1350 RepID=UPI00288EB0A8|nr:GntR family transcriptional regulator [Enterococcus asini]MDT2757156.1 GntR family transcriptional regulator [Enterococcus asini]